jgi:hypothetical protein
MKTSSVFNMELFHSSASEIIFSLDGVGKSRVVLVVLVVLLSKFDPKRSAVNRATTLAPPRTSLSLRHL